MVDRLPQEKVKFVDHLCEKLGKNVSSFGSPRAPSGQTYLLSGTECCKPMVLLVQSLKLGRNREKRHFGHNGINLHVTLWNYVSWLQE